MLSNLSSIIVQLKLALFSFDCVIACQKDKAKMIPQNAARLINAVVAVFVSIGKMVEPPTGDSSNDVTPLSARLRENVDFPLETATDWKWKGDELRPPLGTVATQCPFPPMSFSKVRPRPRHFVFSASKRTGCVQKRSRIIRMTAAAVHRNLKRAEEAKREAKRVEREAERKMLLEADRVMKTHAIKYGLKDLRLTDADPLRNKRGRHLLSIESGSTPNSHVGEVNERPRKKRRIADPNDDLIGNGGEDRMFSEWLGRVSQEQEDGVWVRRM